MVWLSVVLRCLEKPEAGFWRRYIERCTYKSQIVNKKLRGTFYMGKDNWVPTEYPAWTEEAHAISSRSSKWALKEAESYDVMKLKPYKRWPVFEGDVVQVLKGKDAGLLGTVLYTVPERNWVFVEGLNLKFSYFSSMSFLRKEEMPLLLPMEVQLTDPLDDKSTEIEWEYDEEGNQVRVSKRTGRIIPMPDQAQKTPEGVFPPAYKASVDKDTIAADVSKVTFEPYFGTFEEDILNKMGIKEDRKRIQKFWY